MINSATSTSTSTSTSIYTQSVNQKRNAGANAETGSVDGHRIQQNEQAARQTPRESLLSFIDSASPEEARSRLNSYMKGSPVMFVNLKAMIVSGKGLEIGGRINQLNDQFRVEAARVDDQEHQLIEHGRAVGKSSKEILTDIVNLYDNQSEIFKVSIGWDGEQWSDPDKYSRLTELTKNYVNT